jgi:hypothetical protein
MNWHYLDTIYGESNKIMNLCFLVMIVLINLVFQINNPQINIYGHLGGLVIGFFTIFVIQKPYSESDGACCGYPTWLYISIAALVIFHITGFLCFYLL